MFAPPTAKAEATAANPPRAVAPASRSLVVQARLQVGAVSDPLEREADQIADRVMCHESSGAAIATADRGLLRRACQACVDEEQHAAVARRGAGDAASLDGTVAPAGVERVIGAPGRPLGDDASTAFFEQRFQHDFSGIRIHTDRAAADSAKALRAQAYTVGSHIVFGDGCYQPGSTEGRHLIAHELAHTLQQTGGAPLRRAPSAVPVETATRDPAGRVLRRAPAVPCRDLLDAEEAVPIGEKQVQAALAAQMPGSRRELPLPTGSFAPYRDKRYDPGGLRSGDGKIDIALVNSQRLEVMELKHGDDDSAATGLDQLANYVEKGNSDEVADWREKLGVKRVVPMPKSRWTSRHVRAGGSDEPVTVKWCVPGMMVYKAIRDRDRDLFVCTARDQGKVDAFLKRKLHSAFDPIDDYIDREVGPQIEAAINNLSLGQAIQAMATNPTLRHLLEKVVPGGATLLSHVDPKTLGALADQAIGQLGSTVRAVAMEFKSRLIDMVRQRIRDQLMSVMQEELNVLCATVSVLTMDELLKRLRDRAPKLFGDAVGELVPVLAGQMATEALAAAAEAVLTAVAVVCGLVFAVLAIVEVVAAALAAGAVELVGAAVAAIGRALAAAAGGLSVGAAGTLLHAQADPGDGAAGAASSPGAPPSAPTPTGAATALA